MDALTVGLHLGSIGVGYALSVALEWLVHNLVFHKLGKRRGSPFSFHYADHHRAVRKTGGRDPSFEGSRLAWNAYGRELLGIVLGAVLLSPLFFVAPFCTLAAIISGIHYHLVHARSHLDPDWCRAHLRWHWDHHLGTDQDVNWGVTNEWFDRLMGTRVPWWSKEERAAREPLRKAG